MVSILLADQWDYFENIGISWMRELGLHFVDERFYLQIGLIIKICQKALFLVCFVYLLLQAFSYKFTDTIFDSWGIPVERK